MSDAIRQAAEDCAKKISSEEYREEVTDIIERAMRNLLKEQPVPMTSATYPYPTIAPPRPLSEREWECPKCGERQGMGLIHTCKDGSSTVVGNCIPPQPAPFADNLNETLGEQYMDRSKHFPDGQPAPIAGEGELITLISHALAGTSVDYRQKISERLLPAFRAYVAERVAQAFSDGAAQHEKVWGAALMNEIANLKAQQAERVKEARIDEANKWHANWNVDESIRSFDVWAKARIAELEAER